MYHTFKNKDKEVKPPKGWQFSGEPSSLTLSNKDFDVYFLITYRTSKPTGRSLSLSAIYMDKWEVEEHRGQTGIKIKHGLDLSNKEAKEIAVKLAKNLSRKRFMREFIVIVVTAILAGLASFIVSKL